MKKHATTLLTTTLLLLTPTTTHALTNTPTQQQTPTCGTNQHHHTGPTQNQNDYYCHTNHTCPQNQHIHGHDTCATNHTCPPNQTLTNHNTCTNTTIPTNFCGVGKNPLVLHVGQNYKTHNIPTPNRPNANKNAMYYKTAVLPNPLPQGLTFTTTAGTSQTDTQISWSGTPTQEIQNRTKYTFNYQAHYNSGSRWTSKDTTGKCLIIIATTTTTPASTTSMPKTCGTQTNPITLIVGVPYPETEFAHPSINPQNVWKNNFVAAVSGVAGLTADGIYIRPIPSNQKTTHDRIIWWGTPTKTTNNASVKLWWREYSKNGHNRNRYQTTNCHFTIITTTTHPPGCNPATNPITLTVGNTYTQTELTPAKTTTATNNQWGVTITLPQGNLKGITFTTTPRTNHGNQLHWSGTPTQTTTGWHIKTSWSEYTSPNNTVTGQTHTLNCYFDVTATTTTTKPTNCGTRTNPATLIVGQTTTGNITPWKTLTNTNNRWFATHTTITPIPGLTVTRTAGGTQNDTITYTGTPTQETSGHQINATWTELDSTKTETAGQKHTTTCYFNAVTTTTTACGNYCSNPTLAPTPRSSTTTLGLHCP